MPVSYKPPHIWHIPGVRFSLLAPYGEGLGVSPCQPTTHITPLSPWRGVGGEAFTPWRGAGGEAFTFLRGVGGVALSTNNAYHSPLPLERGRGWGFHLLERGWGWGFHPLERGRGWGFHLSERGRGWDFCQFISITFNIMSAIFVTNRQPRRKKSILARVYLGAKTS